MLIENSQNVLQDSKKDIGAAAKISQPTCQGGIQSADACDLTPVQASAVSAVTDQAYATNDFQINDLIRSLCADRDAWAKKYYEERAKNALTQASNSTSYAKRIKANLQHFEKSSAPLSNGSSAP
jgi:hypothetical protein